MQIFTERRSLDLWVAQIKTERKSLGFVPTMGALHAGHISLIQASRAQNDYTICSVFVNPTQFDNAEDLEKYPRNMQEDTKILKDAGCDAVFFPSVTDMYPEGAKSEKFNFRGIEKQMEGRYRKGHFDGVATIVSRFFEIILPDRAYFGQKDFQQLRIIQELVVQRGYPIEIVPMPIFREKSGLAMSSRNARLSEKYLKEASKIFKILNMIKDWRNQYSVTETIHLAEDQFRNTDLKLEYLILADEKKLKPIQSWDEASDIRAFVAVFADNIRLIDNLKII
ncbi:MAG: pantoate--beta-alanine ligase [Flavobacteriaceae bacterium]|nr:pantoate--beta-alanine ligase [Flavobacteriaceae bacterium]